MSITLDEFLLFPEDVYRVGNSSSHKLSAVRSWEVDTMVINGVTVVIANGKGVSLYTIEKIIEKRLTGFAWKFNRGTRIVSDLRLVRDEPEHYMLAPIRNMPVDKYKGLLEEMGLHCSKYYKVKEDGTLLRA
jgi:hypothetical protein